MKLYEELQNNEDKVFIAHKFGVRQVVTFISYMHTVRQVRNVCAHGLLLYDIHLTRRIRRGPAHQSLTESGNIIGALRVIKYIMTQISTNRAEDLCHEVKTLYQSLCDASPGLRTLLPDLSTL